MLHINQSPKHHHQQQHQTINPPHTHRHKLFWIWRCFIFILSKNNEINSKTHSDHHDDNQRDQQGTSNRKLKEECDDENSKNSITNDCHSLICCVKIPACVWEKDVSVCVCVCYIFKVCLRTEDNVRRWQDKTKIIGSSSYPEMLTFFLASFLRWMPIKHDSVGFRFENQVW